MADKKTAIITGASGGIGSGLVDGFLKDGYYVVATSLNTSSLAAWPNLVLVDGDIGKQETAAKVVEAAVQRFGTIDVLVNNAGIIRAKPFTDFTPEDVNALVSVNLLGFLYVTQLAVKQMLKQKSGNVVTITAALADQPVAGVNASVAMITKGGLNTVTRSLAIEYANEGIRFNAVAPGAVDTPLHKDAPKESFTARQRMKAVTEVKDIVDAVSLLSASRPGNRGDHPRRRRFSRRALRAPDKSPDRRAAARCPRSREWNLGHQSTSRCQLAFTQRRARCVGAPFVLYPSRHGWLALLRSPSFDDAFFAGDGMIEIEIRGGDAGDEA
jgi:NAD(P)-dependent dehydrogenase (short-subunit alcohol dehydrogenase family)